MLNCEDCDLPYSEFVMDVVLSNNQWLKIHPSGYDGVLCAQCIIQRIHDLGDTTVAHLWYE